MIGASEEVKLTGTLDGHPVEIIGATRWSYWVTSLDGSLIKIEQMGMVGWSTSGFVSRDRVLLDPDGCQTCPWDRASAYCAECQERGL